MARRPGQGPVGGSTGFENIERSSRAAETQVESLDPKVRAARHQRESENAQKWMAAKAAGREPRTREERQHIVDRLHELGAPAALIEALERSDPPPEAD